MMSSIPPAAISEAATLLQVIADPKQAKAHLDAIKAATDGQREYQAKLEALLAQHNDARNEAAARDAELDKREAELDRIATELVDSKAQHEAEKAAFDAAKAKELAAQEVTRLNVNRDAGVNKAAANKLAAQRDEMAAQEVAVQAMRAGLEEREKAVVEGEAALAAKQARLTAAMQGA